MIGKISHVVYKTFFDKKSCATNISQLNKKRQETINRRKKKENKEKRVREKKETNVVYFN